MKTPKVLRDFGSKEDMVKFLDKLMNGSDEDIAKLLDIKTEDIEPELTESTTEEQQRLNRGRVLRCLLETARSTSHAAQGMFEKAQEHKCDDPLHSTRSRGADDWQPVDMMMSIVYHAHRSNASEIIALLEVVLKDACKKGQLGITEWACERLLILVSSNMVTDAILKSHFMITERGRSNMADLHYDRIVANIRSHGADVAANLEEKLKDNEKAIAGKTD